jgi:hypothetical protein
MTQGTAGRFFAQQSASNQPHIQIGLDEGAHLVGGLPMAFSAGPQVFGA